jgi:hypothetical protein
VDKRASPLGEISLERGEISLERGEISLTSMKISPYINACPGCRDESSKMSPQAIFNNCQNNIFFPASGMKFSHILTQDKVILLSFHINMQPLILML